MKTKSKLSVGCLLLTACLAMAESQQDFTTPLAAAKSYLTAAQVGDTAAIRNACIGSSEQKDVTVQFMRMCVAAAKLDAASTAKFGREETAKAFRDELKQTAATIPDELAALTNGDVKIDGTNATITFKARLTPDAPGPMLKLQQVAGKWKVLLDVGAAKPEISSELMGMVANSMEKCAVDIKAGRYKTAADAQEAQMLAMMTSPYMQKQMAESMEKHPITGQVLDKSGQAVADARVEVYDVNCRELTPRFTTNSGSDGNFNFPVARNLGNVAMLLVSKPGFASSWDFWNPYHGGPEVVVLTPPFMVAGMVKDEAGQPVADAEVWIRSAVIQYHRPNSATDYAHMYGVLARKCFPPAHSGTDGRFIIGQLPATVGVSLVARKGDKVSEKIDNLDCINQLPYYAGQREILLTIGPSGSIGSKVNQGVFGSTTMTITGIVHDGSGKAVEGVKLMTCPALAVNGGYNPTAKSDTNGNYSLTFLVDSLQSDLKLGFSPVLIARDEEHNLAAALDISGDTTNLDFILLPGLEIAGRVEDPDGHPIAKACLQLALDSSNHKTQSYLANYFYANSQGSFQIRGLPQNRLYVIDAQATGHGLVAQRIAVSQTATNRIELRPLVLKVADRPFGGQLLDEVGQPVTGNFVSMSGEGQSSTTVTTDAEGHFNFEKICEGPVNLSANYNGLPGFAKAMAGETNVVLKLKSRTSRIGK